MKNMLRFIGLCFAVAGAWAGQGGVTGTWKAEEVAFAPWTFTLKAEGAKVTGTVSQGGASAGMTTTLTGETPIYDGALEADKVTFKCDSPDGGRTITFWGVVSGDTITFTRECKVQPGRFPGMNGIYGASGATRFTATRVGGSAAPAPAGPAPAPAGPAGTASAGLSVVLLGTGTPIPDPDRSGPAVAVVAGTRACLVDAGPGVVRRAAAAAERLRMGALRPANLTLLFLTHLHSDHTVGYPDLIFTPAVAGRGRPLEVFGPKGTQEMTDHLLAAWKKDMEVRLNGLEHGNPEAYKVKVREIIPGVVYEDGNLTVTAFPVKHATWDEAFGYKFQAGGRTIVISGDTAPTPSLVEAAKGCDVLVHEVYASPGGQEAGEYFKAAHTSAAELAEIATQAKPRLLVLYHQLFSGCSEATLLDEVRQGYAGAVVSAKDLDIY